MIIQFRTTTNGLFNWIIFPAHIFRVYCLWFKDEETNAGRKPDLVTQAVSAEPAIDRSYDNNGQPPHFLVSPTVSIRGNYLLAEPWVQSLWLFLWFFDEEPYPSGMSIKCYFSLWILWNLFPSLHHKVVQYCIGKHFELLGR